MPSPAAGLVALLRRQALSILKQDKQLKCSIPSKQFHALMDHRVLERMLAA